MNFKRAEGGLLRGGPAEVFNFSPEVYLGAPDVDTTIFGDLTPDQFKDLPPVY
jgi:hypothetical protein